MIKRDKVTEHCKGLPSVWSMKLKLDLEPVKYKAQLNIDGGKQEYEVNFYNIIPPVITWTTLRLLFLLASINSFHTFQIDYALTFPQASIEFDMYMEIPKGV